MSVITFKPNDHTKITADFERHEFACPCGCTAQMIDPELVQKMQTIRTKLGKAVKVTSGYQVIFPSLEMWATILKSPSSITAELQTVTPFPRQPRNNLKFWAAISKSPPQPSFC